jgi:hypothetical protein
MPTMDSLYCRLAYYSNFSNSLYPQQNEYDDRGWYSEPTIYHTRGEHADHYTNDGW